MEKNYGVYAKSCVLLIFINKVLLGQTCKFSGGLCGRFSATEAELGSETETPGLTCLKYLLIHSLQNMFIDPYPSD